MLKVIGQSNAWIAFFDEANLFIHESGHTFFSTLGEFAGMAGGTIMQLLVPTISGVYFLYKRDLHSLGFAIFWLGQNMTNISIYAKDARTTLLPLINDGIHDWNWMLTQTGMLKQDQLIGGSFRFIGILLIAIGVGLSGWALFDAQKKRAQDRYSALN